MRRRIKRRLFLMSMALATGTSGHAFAEGGSSVPGEGHQFGGGHPRDGLHFPEGGDDSRRFNSANLLGQARQALTDLGFGGEKGSVGPGRGWRMELLQPEPATGIGGDFRAGKAKPLGVALRVAF